MSNFTSNTSVAPDACYTGMKAWAQCGFGDCVNGTCVCHAGITGHSDLVTLDTTAWGGSTMDCFILSTLVRILWVIPIIPTSLVFVKCIRAIANQFKVYNKRDASKKWWQHPPLLISFLCIPFCPMSVLFCVLKVVWPDTFLIGVDVLCTVLFAVMRVPLYTALAFAQVYNVKVAMTSKAFGNDASVVERITRKLKATQFVVWLGTMVTSVMLIVLVLVSPTLWGKITYYYPITFIAYTKPMQPFFASLLAKRKQGKRIRVTPSTAVSTNTDDSTEDTA
eukprot:g1664.t1